ncbi:protein phosphatase 2C domain-containing protein [Streptomyces sp. NPDC059256]|uniref:PP2C family protein-serine/threonine phosphatase n=1 Tax=Streptomyces sp. NPDC059256 TaxID=3346794 RepID=UPI0036CFBCAF
MSSQMHQSAAGPSCPGCSEPLEEGDRYCGACGFDLSAFPAQVGRDRPTLVLGVPVGPAAWPRAAGVDSAGTPARVQHPGELPGMDSRGVQLPTFAPGHAGADGHGTAGAGPSYGSAASGYGTGSAPHPTAGTPAHGSPAGAFPAGGAAPFGYAADGSTGEPSATGSGPSPQPLRHDDPRSSSGAVPGADGDFTLPAPGEGAGDPTATPHIAKVCVACRAGRVDTDGYCENCGHAQPRERDHMELELVGIAAVSDRGLRHHRNEDAFAIATTALPDGSPAITAIVCDGVSSAVRPDEASLAAASAANAFLAGCLPRGTHPQQAMRDAIVAAADAVNALADGNPPVDPLEPPPANQLNAPACTIVGAICAAGLLVVGWVGDSRVYWVPDDRSAPAARLTEDDSWAAQMVAAGLMSEEEAYADRRAHAITGWLGADAYELDPHTAAFKPDRPGVVVVCTDGLWNYAEAAEDMARVIPPDASVRPLHSAQVLVGHALDGGGHDNVTVAVVPFTVEPHGSESVWPPSGPA